MAIADAEALGHPAVVALVAQLTTRIAALEAEVVRLQERVRQPAKTPENSSLPPAKGFKPDRAARRRAAQAEGEPAAQRGPKPGHPGVSRSRVAGPSVDTVIVCRPERCGACGHGLPAQGGVVVGRRQQLEVPPVQPVVTEAQKLRVRCQHCGHHTTGAYPEGFGVHGRFGPRLLGTISLLHEQQHVGYERLSGLLDELYGIHVSEGTLVAVVQRVAAALEPAATAIAAQVRQGGVVGSDETSARVDGETWWEWVFQTADAAYHTIERRRNTEVVLSFLGGAQPGVWVSDLWKPQLAAPAARSQICLAHQLRDLQYAVDGQRGFAQAWARVMQALLRAAIHLRHQQDAGTVPLGGVAVTDLEATADVVLGAALPAGWSADLQRRFRQHRAALFVFLHDPAVPPTNNASERSLRPSVVHRKVTGGFRSDAGAAAHAILRTVADTARKRGHAVFATILAGLTRPQTAPSQPA
ncbi:MAG TPA: IS66 family transposase [Ktedonobacterales bacterium]|nr:IS66 family transposase [Ktedonobacterales bacterium]